MKKLLHKIINELTEGCDVYYNNGSLWLIFTENKKWVLEFTKDGTLWFNFSFFKGVFELVNLDVMENQDHITVWFEDRFLNKPKVNESHHVDVMKFFDKKMENTIENGVKETIDLEMDDKEVVEYFIENGVKETLNTEYMPQEMVEETIENGVKEIELHKGVRPSAVKDTIENGVKKTKRSYESSRRRRTKDTIQNGVLETKELYWENTPIIDDVIENGINQTKAAYQMIYNPMNFSPEIREEKRISDVTDVIDNGVKEIQPLPAQDGNRDWGNYYHRQKDRTKPHTEYVNDVMSSGIKKTIWRKVENFPEYENRIIVNGVLINNSKDWEIL